MHGDDVVKDGVDTKDRGGKAGITSDRRTILNGIMRQALRE